MTDWDYIWTSRVLCRRETSFHVGWCVVQQVLVRRDDDTFDRRGSPWVDAKDRSTILFLCLVRVRRDASLVLARVGARRLMTGPDDDGRS